MNIVKFNTQKLFGGFKPMNAVNNGPVHKRHVTDQKRTNLHLYKDAKIPYARNHDAAFDKDYGSEHSTDITAVFPDFSKDPYSPESYDFACTDEYIRIINLAGTKTFYRLGQKIEHYVKKYGTIPPTDFNKWAVVCEHIIRHYTEGWADGFDAGIEYWEIWNEPDLDDDNSPNKRTWGGTKAQFFDLFEITAKHLKKCFPNLKIGGPALAWNETWADEFLCEMQKRNTPIDFFSWHIYCTRPEHMTQKAERIKAMLVKYGYQNAESILNEWNYVRGWEDDFIYSIRQIIGNKGAAFTMACMTESQKSSVDMLMYYDARPCVFNGLFDFYSLEPLKGYYPFKWYSGFYGLSEIRAEATPENIHSLGGIDENGKVCAIVTYYTDDDGMPSKDIEIDFGRSGKYEVFVVDEDRTAESVGVTDKLSFEMKPNSFVLVKEV